MSIQLLSPDTPSGSIQNIKCNLVSPNGQVVPQIKASAYFATTGSTSANCVISANCVNFTAGSAGSVGAVGTIVHTSAGVFTCHFLNDLLTSNYLPSVSVISSAGANYYSVTLVETTSTLVITVQANGAPADPSVALALMIYE